MPDLLTPCRVGGMELAHRVVLAPLTRHRAAEPTLAPTAVVAEYYAQRASPGGLLISEATHISPETFGHHEPHIWTDAHVAGWRAVTDAVHQKGARIFCQLWHVGRQSHPAFAEHPLAKGSGRPLPSVSASDVAMRGSTMTYKGVLKNAAPRPLLESEIPRLVEDYLHAARCAVASGFDGVELHAAHGYLIDQFLTDRTNRRADRYGGSIPNRCRLLFDVVAALCGVVGDGKVAVRLSPGMYRDSDPTALYSHAVSGLNAFPLAYLLLTENRWNPGGPGDPEKDVGMRAPMTNGPLYRPLYKGTLMGAGGFTPESAKQAIEAGTYDLIAFGRWFISNPDLPQRVHCGAELNVYNRNTFYTVDAEGYTDYPDLAGSVGVKGKYRTVSPGTLSATLKETLKKAKM